MSVMSICSWSSRITSPTFRMPLPVVDNATSDADCVEQPAPDCVSPVAAALLPVTMHRSPVTAPSAPAVPGYAGNGAAAVPGSRISTSPAPACDPSETITVASEVPALAVSVPAATGLYQPHVPVTQMECCGVGPAPHAAVVDRSSSIRVNGQPGLRFTGSRNTCHSGIVVPDGDCIWVITHRSWPPGWSNQNVHGYAYCQFGQSRK